MPCQQAQLLGEVLSACRARMAAASPPLKLLDSCMAGCMACLDRQTLLQAISYVHIHAMFILPGLPDERCWLRETRNKPRGMGKLPRTCS